MRTSARHGLSRQCVLSRPCCKARHNKKRNAEITNKRLAQTDAAGKRVRGGKTVPRNRRGMCSSDPPLPPKLREEDEVRVSEERTERKKLEKRKKAARALREKMAAKKVPGAAKPLGAGPGQVAPETDDIASDDDEGSDKGSEDDEAVEAIEGEGAGSVPDYFVDALKALGHKGTTPIQRECWPLCCSGRDVLGIAPPGSGKTLAYLLPAAGTTDAVTRPTTSTRRILNPRL